MLTRIKIENFRLCKDVTIDNAGAIVALVGRNGAGKSNILQAISQTARIATSSEQTLLLTTVRPGIDSLVNLAFELDGKEYEYELGISLPGRRKNIIEETILRKDDGRSVELVKRRGRNVTLIGRAEPLLIGDFGPSLSAISAVLPATDDAVIEIRPVVNFLSGIRYYPLNEPTERGGEERPIPDSEFTNWTSVAESGRPAADETPLIRILYLYHKRQDDFAALEQLIGPNGLGLVDAITIHKVPAQRSSTATSAAPEEQYYHFVRFTPSRGPNAPQLSVTYDELSLGTRRLIRLIVSMLYDKSSVMLLEQPEDSLHQGMTKKVIGALRRNAHPAQLIFSSHSSALLNKLNPEEIRLVSLHDGFTEVRELTPDELDAAEDFMNSEGPLYDFLEPLQGD